MSGDNKTWILTIMTAAVLLGWAVWNWTNYAIATAGRTPTTAEVLFCVNQCASACAEQAERGEP